MSQDFGEVITAKITNTLTLVNNRGLRFWREYLQQKMSRNSWMGILKAKIA